MRIVSELDHKIRREIRDARAIDPLVSVVDLQEHLEEKFNRTFSRKYIAKLAFKVERQALQEADRTKIEQRMQFTRENYRMMRERLLKILYWKPEDGGKPPADRDVNEAAKNIVMMDLAISAPRPRPAWTRSRSRRWPRNSAPIRSPMTFAW